MRFLVDENLPPSLAKLLTASGHDAVHIRDLEAARAPDSAVMSRAASEDRVIISADTDFGALLAQARATKPSVILVREIMGLRPASWPASSWTSSASSSRISGTGAIAAITAAGIRVRPLPLR